MVRIACIGLLLCPLPAFALDISGSIGKAVHYDDESAAENSNEESESPMLAAALNDPRATAADLGLASPGSAIRLPSFTGADE